MIDYEKLGAFYLGKRVSPDDRSVLDEPVLYDAKDLTTHAVCVGMTGSGKTGLCVSLLEEAALDGVPAIAIDPKGDLANLCLTFPKLRAADFEPWIDPGEAARTGAPTAEYAASVAKLWKRGLADWGQDGARIAKLRDAAEIALYTPGSDAARGLTPLRSLDPPPESVRADADALRERVASCASALLSLLGIDADPIRSREHILVAQLVERAWHAGRAIDLPTLIREIQSPPIERVGVLELEAFYPAGDRFELAMRVNNLLASPGFGGWMSGEPLDVARLLRGASGRPRISIVSIAHLSEAERMFFVTLLLNEVVTWVRAQPGTPSLRAILYMDEVFGYFPPTANPPSKRPMLTLLKQARAHGLGVVLATQNPVDLDYKGLSNTGTWFLGRLQTERDKARVLEGLEGVASSAFDRDALDKTLAGLGKRVFLMNNVHDDAPTLFHTRWAMSYLRGPLTRDQIRRLPEARPATAEAAPTGVAPRATAAPAAPATAAPRATPAAPSTAAETARPAIAKGIEERFGRARREAPVGSRLVYRPSLTGTVRLHFVRAAAKIDAWNEIAIVAERLPERSDDPWDGAERRDGLPETDSAPAPGFTFGTAPAGVGNARTVAAWKKKLEAHAYRTETATVWRAPAFKRYSELGATEADFRASLAQAVREKRDVTVEKLRKRYAPKLKRLEDRIRTAEARIDRERSQLGGQKLQTAISIGAGVLGALFGNKLGSARNVGRAATAARGVGRARREASDVARAQEELDARVTALRELEAEFEEELAAAKDAIDVGSIELEAIEIRPRKSDIDVTDLALVWTPWSVGADGIAEPL